MWSNDSSTFLRVYNEPKKIINTKKMNMKEILLKLLFVLTILMSTTNVFAADKGTKHWSGFGSIVSLTDEDTGVTFVKAEQKDAQYYNLKGVQVENASKGLYIVNGKKVVM